MPRCFYGNFDFEHELADPNGWQTPARIRQVLAEQVSAWVAIADDGDIIWTPEPIADEFWEQLASAGLPRVCGTNDLWTTPDAASNLVPWGWSRRATQIGLGTPHADEQAVRLGNSREWSFAIEQEFGVALRGAARITRVEDFSSTVAQAASEFGEPVADFAWIIKANFGMAGRGRILGRGPRLTGPNMAWLLQRVAADGAVYFEPWLSIREEVGVQITVPCAGIEAPILEGIAPLWCNAQGGYRGSQFSMDTSVPTEWQPAVDVCLRAAERLQSRGYFGPLGIDAATFVDWRGETHLRPLQDINARFTMGRLALGFRRLLRGKEIGAWRHGMRSASDFSKLPKGARAVAITPPIVGNLSPQNRSVVLIAARKDALLQAVRELA